MVIRLKDINTFKKFTDKKCLFKKKKYYAIIRKQHATADYNINKKYYALNKIHGYFCE